VRIDPDTCRDPVLLSAEVRRLQTVIAAGEPSLTDEEQRAIEWAAEMMEVGSLPNSLNRRDARVLRGLLERLG
jgi:hypothetical protein